MILARTLFLIAIVLLLACPAGAQQVTGRFSTSVYGWERFDTVNSSRHVYRGYQLLQLEASQDNVSLQSYITGSSNLSQSFGDEANVRVSNLFLKVRDIQGLADASLGRIPVFAGVGIGTVDGAMLRFHSAGNRVIVTGYGGANVHSDLHSKGFTDLNNNFLVGGQVIVMPQHALRLAASYMNRRTGEDPYTSYRTDSLLNPVPFTFTPEPVSEQLAGFDASYRLDRTASFHGRYDYDINNKRSLLGELEARASVTEDLAVTGNFFYREPRVIYHSFFANLPYAPNREYEGGVEYSFCRWISAFGRFGYVRYENDLSRRLSAGLMSKYVSFRISGTNGYAGELSSFSVDGMYPMLDNQLTPTLGVSFARYRPLAAADQNDLVSGSLGAILRPMPSFSVDAQIQVLRNPIVNSDVRGFGRISYWFHHNFAQPQMTEGAGK